MNKYVLTEIEQLKVHEMSRANYAPIQTQILGAVKRMKSGIGSELITNEPSG
jgi:hypothetical protein